MPMLRILSRLSMALGALLAGCFEGGALDPISSADMLTTSSCTNSYREFSLLENGFTGPVMGSSCTNSTTPGPLTITIQSGNNSSCVTTSQLITIPEYTKNARLHVVLSSDDKNVFYGGQVTFQFSGSSENSNEFGTIYLANLNKITMPATEVYLPGVPMGFHGEAQKIAIIYQYGINNKSTLTFGALSLILDGPMILPAN